MTPFDDEAQQQPSATVLPRGPGVLRYGTAGFANALATGFFYPFALLFYTHLSGVSLRSVGILLTVTALAALPGLPLIGRLVDRLGCRPVLVTALVLRALCFAGSVSFPGLLSLRPPALWPVPAGLSVVSALLLLPDARGRRAAVEPAPLRPTP